MNPTGPVLSASRLDVSVPGRALVRALDLDVGPGEFLTILGQNGSGKTLTLHTLAGLRAAAAGEITLDARPIAGWPRRQLAQKMALLPQDSDDIFPASVFDTVLIGRHPHVAALRLESARDRQIAEDALDTMALLPLKDRDVVTLSGGERRRLAIAQVLTQSPQVYLLDEPLNHLDPQHQLHALALFRRLADAGASVTATLHDVNLAARFGNRALLLNGDGSWQLGNTTEILTPENLGRLYGVQMDSVEWQGQTLFVPSDRNDAALQSVGLRRS